MKGGERYMNLTVFASVDGAYVNCECIKGYAFKSASAWDNCALLPVLTADFGLSQDNSAHFAVLNASRLIA